MGPKRLQVLQPRLLLAGLLMLIGFGAYSTAAAAQDEVEAETATVTTQVLTCLEPGCTEQIELAEPADGVALEFTDTATGDVLGSCVAGDLEPGICAVEIPFVESVTIMMDESTLPEGYEPTENPGVLALESDVAEYPFLLFPVGGFPEDGGDDEATPEAVGGESDDAGVSELPATGMQAATPEVSDLPATGMQAATPDAGVAELPSTGTGSNGNSTGVMLTGVALIASVLGLATVGARRLAGRR